MAASPSVTSFSFRRGRKAAVSAPSPSRRREEVGNHEGEVEGAFDRARRPGSARTPSPGAAPAPGWPSWRPPWRRWISASVTCGDLVRVDHHRRGVTDVGRQQQGPLYASCVYCGWIRPTHKPIRSIPPSSLGGPRTQAFVSMTYVVYSGIWDSPNGHEAAITPSERIDLQRDGRA